MRASRTGTPNLPVRDEDARVQNRRQLHGWRRQRRDPCQSWHFRHATKIRGSQSDGCFEDDRSEPRNLRLLTFSALDRKIQGCGSDDSDTRTLSMTPMSLLRFHLRVLQDRAQLPSPKGPKHPFFFLLLLSLLYFTMFTYLFYVYVHYDAHYYCYDYYHHFCHYSFDPPSPQLPQLRCESGPGARPGHVGLRFVLGVSRLGTENRRELSRMSRAL